MLSFCRASALLVFSGTINQALIDLSDFRRGQSGMMAARRDRIRIEVYGDAKDGAQQDASPSDDAVLRLARPLGRQIARGQFNQNRGKERGPTAGRNARKER
jgi:hypothetical protein